MLSHEVGHWLNLMHCWGNSNEPGQEENCEIDDDVEDTPNTIGWTCCSLAGRDRGWSRTMWRTTWSIPIATKCSHLDRRSHGRGTHPTTRAAGELWQPENLTLAGVLDAPVLCLAQFGSTQEEICTSESVQFFD